MLMLHQYITRSLLALFLSTLLLSGIVSYFTIKNNNIQRYQHELQTRIEFIKYALEKAEDQEAFAKAFKEKTGYRFTLIKEDGEVIAESDYNPEGMNNHAHREEIIKSQSSEFGSSIRFSNTLKSDFLYVASRFDINGQILYIRLASDIGGIMHDFYDLWLKVAFIFGASILIGLYGVYRLSQKIRHEIDKIITNLQQIADKEYRISITSHFSSEFFEIANYLKKLAAKLEKRARQKRKYTAKIKLISQQRSDVISAISHEFKNPIASIMGYAQTLLEDSNCNPQIRERFLSKILHNGQKISTMIDRLTLTTKFENGDFQTQPSSFDIGKLTHDSVQTFREKHKERILTCNVPELIITADKTMMEIVISNLIDNALKYSQEEVVIYLEEGSLHVKDSGIGIKAEEIDKVAQKFYRSNSHTWDNSMGLGLALVNYILKLHHSQLEIQSTFGKGSDFSFKLP